jgi:hypothetical protein
MGHLQYVNFINKTVYTLSLATLCTMHTAVESMYHFIFTQDINKFKSANYTPVWQEYCAHLVEGYVYINIHTCAVV